LGILLTAFVFVGFTNAEITCNNKDKAVLDTAKIWVGTWSTAPQLVEPHNMPPSPGLTNNVLRQIVRVSIGGDSLRVRFSNAFSTAPVTMNSVQIAVSKGASSIEKGTIKQLTFNGKLNVTMEPGATITSDPIAFDLKSRMDLAITIQFGATSEDVTGHPGSRTTSYIKANAEVSEIDLEDAVKTDHWYVINGIDVKTNNKARAVAILGNSITDGRGSGTNKQNRWPDILSERLIANSTTENVAVLNMGIGGNCVLRECLGPSGIDRIDRDIFKQYNVRWLIILEGVNDIGQAKDSIAAAKIANELIAAYDSMITLAHENNLLVYGATILPINKSFYYLDFRETARKTVNEWIRNSGRFDAVIDFDLALQDPNDPSTLLPESHMGDYLHPNEAGYKMMGEAVNLSLFE
jgi:lysophospholipase L1-like esterase